MTYLIFLIWFWFWSRFGSGSGLGFRVSLSFGYLDCHNLSVHHCLSHLLVLLTFLKWHWILYSFYSFKFLCFIFLLFDFLALPRLWSWSWSSFSINHGHLNFFGLVCSHRYCPLSSLSSSLWFSLKIRLSLWLINFEFCGYTQLVTYFMIFLGDPLRNIANPNYTTLLFPLEPPRFQNFFQK